MRFCKYFIISIIIMVFVIQADAGRFRRRLRKIEKSVKKNVKKVGCKVVFGVVCPAAVTAAGTVIGAGTSGVGSVVVAAGVAAGNQACNVQKKKCKRSADEVLLSFSDKMSDYDLNGDKLISYEEFLSAVLRTVPLADPNQLEEPFIFADFDDDGFMDTDEFNGAPFMFARK
ncbi:hypothetical protein ACF0H5_007252 [Mactra antiquata]